MKTIDFDTSELTGQPNDVATVARDAILGAARVDTYGRPTDAFRVPLPDATPSEDQIAAKRLADWIFAGLTSHTVAGKRLEVEIAGTVDQRGCSFDTFEFGWVD